MVARNPDAAVHILVFLTAMLVLAEMKVAPPGDGVQCHVLYLVRDWPEAEADGFYRLTDKSCGDEYPDPYYVKVTPPERYFYRLTSGYWMLYISPCNVTHIGVTGNSTSQPWTTDFVDVGNVNTSISCVDYVEVVTHPPTESSGTWSLPEFKYQQPYVEYELIVRLPDNVMAVSFDIKVENGDCASGNISLYRMSSVDRQSQVASLCFDGLSQSVSASYPLVHASKSFLLRVSYDREENMQANPLLTVDYAVSLDESDIGTVGVYPEETPLPMRLTGADVIGTSGVDSPSSDAAEPETSVADVWTSEAGSMTPITVPSDGSLDTSNVSTDPEYHSTTSSSSERMPTEDYSGNVPTVIPSKIVSPDSVETTQETTTVEDEACIGLTCYAGLPCREGKCPCPTITQCSDYHDFEPVCASDGITYASRCHVRAEICGRGRYLKILHPGLCPPKPPSSRRPPSTVTEQTTIDPETEAVSEGTDWSTIIIGIIVFVIVALTIAVIIAIICAKRRANRQRRIMKKENRAPPTGRYNVKPSMTNSARRSRPFSRSSNTSFRASPKSQPRLTIKVKPDSEIDPDRFSLSGCITPLCDVPDNPLSTFTSARTPKDEDRRPTAPTQGSVPRKDRPMSFTDNGVFELTPDTDSGIQMASEPIPDQHDPAPVKMRSSHPQRTSSATESKVYEIQLEPGVVLDFDLDNVFDDSHLTTRL